MPDPSLLPLQSASTRTKPPGGKALMRLLHFLASRGDRRAAEVALQSALPGNLWSQVRSRAGLPAPGDPSSLAAPVPTSAPTAAPAASPAATGPLWKSLGPVTTTNGQTYGASRVNVSGRVSAIAVDPQNPAHVLCGAAAGGVWESQDRGATWAPRTDSAPSLAVGAIAFDPNNPKLVYCGTGEGNSYFTLGAGILKSTDGGTTWNLLASNPFLYQGFFDLKVNPANSQHLLAANTFGLYQSFDGGTTWAQQPVTSAWSISIAPGGGPPGEILVARADGVWQSFDNGVTWYAVSLPGTPESFDRVAVAHAPSDPGVAYVFGAGPPAIPNPNSGNSMATPYLWVRPSANADFAALPASGYLDTSQDWYDWFLAVAPDNASQIYLGAIDSYRVDIAGPDLTWTPLSDKGTTITASGAPGDSIHPDQHAIAFEPGAPATLYIGCDGGIFRSPDRGITWDDCNNGLVIAEFEYIAHNRASPNWIIGGTQDNGTQLYTGSTTWQQVADGDGGDCAVNYDNPNIVFAEHYYVSPMISSAAGALNSWDDLTPPVPPNETSLFYCPFTASVSGGATIALGTVAVYVSQDNGTTWTRLSFDPPAKVTALFVPNANTVYAGTEDGRIFQSSWNGTAWAALTPLGAPRAGATVSCLEVDPNNLQQILATYSAFSNSTNGAPPLAGMFFVSSDGGVSWQDRSAGLPNQPVLAVETDPRNASRLWVGTDLGVYQSLDLGKTWTNFSNGLPNVLIGDLLFHPTALLLRAGTRSRGVWEVAVDGPAV